jgi:hypothetical protein
VPARLLARAAPFVLGAIAAGIWLRRRQAERPALRERTGEVPPPVPPAPAAPRAPRAPRASRRFQRPATARFVRVARRRPIDIVAVVDDLLGAAR